MEAVIQEKLACLFPVYMQIINESHQHAGPANNSHFKLIIVSNEFEGVSALQRQRKLYALLSDELAGEIHALSMFLYTPEEWEKRQSVPESPKCQGARPI